MYLLLFAIAFPIICGLIMPLFNKSASRKPALAFLIGAQVVETVAVLLMVLSKESSTGLFTMTEDISVGFTSDGIGKFFSLIVTVGWLLVSIYAAIYMKHETKEPRFYLFMLLSEGVMIGAALSTNLVSMYVFYEFVTLFSMPLVLHSLSEESIAAAKKYLFYSVAGAFMALFGIFVLASSADTLDFISGGTMTELSPTVLVAVFVMCLGFGAKAGLFPLHGWLPTAHPVAPAPASALLSGLIAKAGVLAIIRTIFFVVGADNLAGTWVQITLLILSLLTVLMGSMMAYKEKIFKKRLAYSTVSQISYVLTGLFMFSTEGLRGAMWQISFHAVVKIGLFLCAGAVIFLYGKTKVEDLVGIGKKMPVTFVAFTILSLSLIGIPPTGGFTSKWYLATASLDTASIGALSWIAPAILLLSALLTAGYLLPISVKAFFTGHDSHEEELPAKKEPLMMIIPIVVLAVIALFGGIFAQTVDGGITAVISTLM